MHYKLCDHTSYIRFNSGYKCGCFVQIAKPLSISIIGQDGRKIHVSITWGGGRKEIGSVGLVAVSALAVSVLAVSALAGWRTDMDDLQEKESSKLKKVCLSNLISLFQIITSPCQTSPKIGDCLGKSHVKKTMGEGIKLILYHTLFYLCALIRGSSRKQPLYFKGRGMVCVQFTLLRPYFKRDILNMFGLVWCWIFIVCICIE